MLQELIEAQFEAGGGPFRPLKPRRNRAQRQHVFLKTQMPPDLYLTFTDPRRDLSWSDSDLSDTELGGFEKPDDLQTEVL